MWSLHLTERFLQDGLTKFAFAHLFSKNISHSRAMSKHARRHAPGRDPESDGEMESADEGALDDEFQAFPCVRPCFVGGCF